MNELISILTELHDDVDFTTETGLIENGILNSLDIVSIITEVSDRFDVTIPAEEITDGETEADTQTETAPEKGGCKSSLMGVTATAVAMAAAVALRKRKEN